MQRELSGTVCSRLAFIRSAGTVQSFLSRLNSGQVAPMTRRSAPLSKLETQEQEARCPLAFEARR
jgi:hypothetical protein